MTDPRFSDVAVREVATPARFSNAEEHFEVVRGLLVPGLALVCTARAA